MSEFRVTIDRQAERAERTVTTGTTVGELFAAEFSGDRSNIAARLRSADGAGVLVDLARPLSDGDVVEPVAIDSDDGRAILRHSAAHVMAQAVQEVFPEARLGIGPPIKDGFYYDFQVDRPFTPEDLKAVEQKMQAIVKQGQRFSRRPVSDAEAREELADEPFKLELIGLKGSASTAAEGASAEVGAGELTI
ncbi:MAG: threonine--tRNA ligase, partial [Actinocrinis sp.]